MSKTYLQTHPWIRFSADLRRADTNFWIMLGECQSKCEHIAGVPLQPKTEKKLYQLYLAKGALATTAIEGNTLSEEEVLQHFEGRLRLPPSREYLTQEIDNIVAACNQILGAIAAGWKGAPNVDWFKQLNRDVLKDLSLEDGVVPGEIRRHSVGVARYKAPPAEESEYLLDRLCGWLNGPEFAASQGLGIAYAIIKAILAHIYLAWIHPFGDGNGRTARLVEFHILINSGVPAPAAHLLSNHYNQTRTEYYRQLDQASRSGGDVLPFLSYAVAGFLEGLRSQLAAIREQQWRVSWENYVHDFFREKSDPQNRRRYLLLDLSEQDELVPIAKIPDISARVAKLYARKSSKTLMRDVKWLEGAGLLKVEGEGLRANREIILAFLPPRSLK